MSLICLFSACGDGDDPGKTDKKPGEGEVETTDCGNGQIDTEEVCDSWNVGDKTCALLGYGGGSLGCQADCTGYDVSACTNSAAGCGNNVKEGAEVCDGTDLVDQNCGTLNLGTGMLGCLNDCSGFDTQNCSGGGTSNCTGPATYTSNGALNTNLADGEPCNFDSDCLNDCNTATYYCGAEDVTPTTHEADLPLGAACDKNESCASNYCYAGGDTWICAEPCAAAETATPGSLACKLSEEGAQNPSPLGGACVPTGDGAIGVACSSGAFDCASGICWDQNFCTEVCDPADGTNCGSASCELLSSNPFFGDTYICVPASEMSGATGSACAVDFNCVEGNVCVDEVCTLSCPNGDECGAGTYCATDHPSGPICLSDDTLGELGSDCEFDSQCGENNVCFSDGEESKCRALCPEGTCADGTSCVQAQTGAALDTVIKLFDNVADTEADAEDDDGGEGYFSKLDYPFTADGTVYAAVSRYAGSPLGDYTLSVSTDTTAVSGGLTEDESTTDNNSNANATVVTVGTKVAATFSAEEDVDVFSIALTGTGTLTLETGRSESGVCLPEGTELQPDGAACTSPASCENTCFPFSRGDTSFCTTACSDDTDCGGTAGSCVSFFDITPPDPGEGYCFPSGEIALGAKTFGETCAGPHECGSKLCLKHPYGENWVCGASCETADAACESNAGVCSGSDPTYNTACVPHLAGSVDVGGDCAWDADCMTGNVCLSNKCSPQTSYTNYDIGSPKRPNGSACNVDADCVSDDCSSFICSSDDIVGCIGDSNNTIDSNDDDESELCDGTDVGTATCADLGAGTGTLKCSASCRAYDLSDCTGLANGQPCNGSSQCQDGSVCATPSKDGDGPGDTWFCAASCTGEDDTDGCSGTLFATNLAVACRPFKAGADADTAYACLPQGGVNLAAEPCLSGYFDCNSGSCWNESFCIADCELGDTECGRDGACVSYTYNVETDTQIEFVNSSGASLGDPVDDNRNANDSLVNLYSSASYVDSSSDGDLDSVWVKVESSSYYADVGEDPDTGAYQLQLFTSSNPPPFGSVSLESELKEVPADNSSIGQAQLVDDLTPVRFSASLAEGDDADVDYFRVQLNDGETLYAATTYPLNQVCWPGTNLGKEAGAECEFSFECAAGACFTGKCATECTGGVACEPGFECDAFYGSQRFYCFPKLTFNDDCETAALGSSMDTPSCPNNLCLTRGENFWCSESCETEGGDCGNQDTEGNYDGECWEIVEGPLGTQNICVPHKGASVAAGAECIVNADCASDCCDQDEGECSAASTNCNGS
ncbi:MAG: hypothetical protein QGI45_07855 [Myxococcota bacterium]|nr:hypothetical protein [Myxococcota bacterium]